MLRDIVIAPSRVLPARLLSVSFARSGGPGGQNVNKVATKADVRLDLRGAAAVLGPEDAARLAGRLSARLDPEGRLQVVSSEHRTQARNLEAALARMEALLRAALERPVPRRPTRPTRASRERRLAEKRRRSQVKRWRAGADE